MSKFDDIMTEDLVGELMNRFDHVVFMGRRDSEKGKVELKDFEGDTTILMGLCGKLMRDIGNNASDIEHTEDGFQ